MNKQDPLDEKKEGVEIPLNFDFSQYKKLGEEQIVFDQEDTEAILITEEQLQFIFEN